jgi:hypothetical protein
MLACDVSLWLVSRQRTVGEGWRTASPLAGQAADGHPRHFSFVTAKGAMVNAQ